MGRTARACAGFFVALAVVIAALASVGAATAGTASCEEKVLSDWSDNGRVDGIYPLHCYEDALVKMPTDLRDYTNASDAIDHALTRALSADDSSGTSRVAAGAAPGVGANGPSSLPLPLVLLATLSLLVLAAGGAGYLSRRRRAGRE
jgi:hypothetical protein